MGLRESPNPEKGCYNIISHNKGNADECHRQIIPCTTDSFNRCIDKVDDSLTGAQQNA